jgi:hypothetical protein
MNKEKRRTFLINPRFQLSFMAYTVGMSALIIAIFYCANVYFFWKFNNSGVQLGLPPDHVYFQFLAEQKFKMNLVFGVTSTIAFAALGVWGLFLSHRVAGPVYRLCKHARDLVSGKDVGEVSFRKKDYFPELADAFNEQFRWSRGTGSAEKKSDQTAA